DVNARSEMSRPSSSGNHVTARPVQPGLSATQTLRAPWSLYAQQTLSPLDEATRRLGNGADITCSRVKDAGAAKTDADEVRARTVSSRRIRSPSSGTDQGPETRNPTWPKLRTAGWLGSGAPPKASASSARCR